MGKSRGMIVEVRRNGRGKAWWFVKVGRRLIPLEKAIKEGIVKLLYSTKKPKARSWKEYFLLKKREAVLIRISMDKRGKLQRKYYSPIPLSKITRKVFYQTEIIMFFIGWKYG